MFNKLSINILDSQIIGAIIAFILAVFVVPAVSYVAYKFGLVDKPNARKVHKVAIPRIGGAAIWFCTMATFSLLVLLSYYPFSNGLSAILIPGSLMFLLGFTDDIFDLSPKFKLFIQLTIATIAVLLGIKIDFITNPFGGILHLGLFAFPITVLWLVTISNAMNFIDGVDGLAGTVSTLSAITLAIVALLSPVPQPVSALVATILAGSMLGFLLFNYNPAKIFMGDGGALFSGFVLAALSVTGVMKSVALTIFLPVLILLLPIMDITFSVLRRLMLHKSPFIADSEHIHHKLLKAGFSHNRTVVVFVLIAICAGFIATYIVNAQYTFLLTFSILLPLMFVLNRLSKSKLFKKINEEIIIENTVNQE